MSWNASYGLLILISSFVTWISARILTPKTNATSRQNNKNKFILWSCLIVNLGILFIFKYSNFVIDTINSIPNYIRFGIKVPLLEVLLPVGISFYTFQAIGYTIDVYRGTIKPEKNFFTYALFVSFFPQLVAGPIERAKNLLPQFNRKHIFNTEKAMEGFQLMVWGYFMKICVADRAAIYVDTIFNDLSNYSGSSVLLASFLFTIQIYCDFCGYSLIAIGVAKLMGYDLMENFHRPYFSTNIRDFWKRWHISLSSWFMDYVYIPLGGNRCSLRRHLLNLFITFVVSGMWHGANWTFMIWGIYHGILIIISTLCRKYSSKKTYDYPLHRLIKGICTFLLVMFGWIIFRSNNLEDAYIAINKIFSKWTDLYVDKTVFFYFSLSFTILFMYDLLNELNKNIIKKYYYKDLTYSLLIIAIIILGCFSGGKFIYFQF